MGRKCYLLLISLLEPTRLLSRYILSCVNTYESTKYEFKKKLYIATLSILLTQPCDNKGWADDTSKYDTVQGCSKIIPRK